MRVFRSLLITTICVVFIAGVVSAEKVTLNGNSPDLNIVVEESNDSRTVVTFEIGSYLQDEVDVNGETYFSVGHDDLSILLNEGEPALPRICRSIIIPDDARVGINVLSSKYIDIPNMPVVPSKRINE